MLTCTDGGGEGKLGFRNDPKCADVILAWSLSKFYAIVSIDFW